MGLGTHTMSVMGASEQELEVLANIVSHSEHIRQRDIARIVGLSLGMTNAIVKRLVQKGWLTIRKINNRNIRYAVSGSGLEQITLRSYRYFKRSIKNIVKYREAIEALARDVKRRGHPGLILVGSSDLDFIVEHACSIHGLRYKCEDRATPPPHMSEREPFVLYSEKFRPNDKDRRPTLSRAFLQEVLGGHDAERILLENSAD